MIMLDADNTPLKNPEGAVRVQGVSGGREPVLAGLVGRAGKLRTLPFGR